MKYLFIFPVLLTVVVSRSVDYDWRIVGGEDAKKGDCQSLCSLQYSGEHYCGCVMISDSWCVTAAHCTNSNLIKDAKIMCGSNVLKDPESHGGKLFPVTGQYPNPKYNPRLFQNDIGLVKVKTNHQLNVKTIKIYPEYIPANKFVRAYGWGSKQLGSGTSNIKQKLNLTTTDNESCSKRLGVTILHDTGMCTVTEEGHGMCHGDSGGPLTYTDAEGWEWLVGLVSFGRPCARGYPDAFTRVGGYKEWMKEIMTNN